MKYIGIDGDNIGEKLELFFLENQEEKIKRFSQSVDLTLRTILQDLEKQNAQLIFCSGDSLLCKMKNLNLVFLSDLIQRRKGNINFSIGIGNTIKDAYIALKYAKVSGKNKIVVVENERYIVV